MTKDLEKQADKAFKKFFGREYNFESVPAEDILWRQGFYAGVLFQVGEDSKLVHGILSKTEKPDGFALLSKAREVGLPEGLKSLSLEELVAIIRQNRYDPSGAAAGKLIRAKGVEGLIDFITKRSNQRMSHGNVFMGANKA